MKYAVSVIDVIGQMWWPVGAVGATILTLDASDVENAKSPTGRLTRDSVGRWLDTHAGDFSEVIDFRASLELSGETVEIDWGSEDSEPIYSDCMSGNEAD